MEDFQQNIKKWVSLDSKIKGMRSFCPEYALEKLEI